MFKKLVNWIQKPERPNSKCGVQAALQYQNKVAKQVRKGN